ncbi:MAG: bifunctional oligoribonuclease/PAP phosphatase NrnA [Planctomycetes bacterium]|nr:bifunctional oligoribonuclease/PAP phosphatase NrnA [Planctomycetota bacterium]
MQSNAPTSPAVPDEVIEAITRLRAPIAISHVVPDADALGSSLATVLSFGSDGRDFKLALPDGSLSQRLAFLAELAGFSIASADDFARADGFVVLDTAKKKRCNVGADLKQTDWSAGRPVINIDHHEGNTRFGDINWIVGDAGSTCELVFYLLRAAEVPITPAVASLLYAGIQTDTLGFSLPSTTAAALHAAAFLIESGADVALLGERLGRSQRKSEFELLRVVYANTKIVGEGDIAYSFAGYDEIHDAGCTAADIDDQISVPRSLDGVRLAMLFTEGRKGATRINFRGSGDVTVVDLASEFGGGGHSQAAGAVVDGTLDEVIAKVIRRAKEYIKKFS